MWLSREKETTFPIIQSVSSKHVTNFLPIEGVETMWVLRFGYELLLPPPPPPPPLLPMLLERLTYRALGLRRGYYFERFGELWEVGLNKRK